MDVHAASAAPSVDKLDRTVKGRLEQRHLLWIVRVLHLDDLVRYLLRKRRLVLAAESQSVSSDTQHVTDPHGIDLSLVMRCRSPSEPELRDHLLC